MYAHYVLYDFLNNTAKNFESIRWKKNKIRFRWITVYIRVITDPVLKSITTRYRGNSILASKAVIDFCLISRTEIYHRQGSTRSKLKLHREVFSLPPVWLCRKRARIVEFDLCEIMGMNITLFRRGNLSFNSFNNTFRRMNQK